MKMTLHFVQIVDGKLVRGNSMKCRDCGTENLSTSKFCKTCGAGLESIEIDKFKKDFDSRIERLEKKTFKIRNIYPRYSIRLMITGLFLFIVGLCIVIWAYNQVQSVYTGAEETLDIEELEEIYDKMEIGNWTQVFGFIIFAIGSIDGLHTFAKNLERILGG